METSLDSWIQGYLPGRFYIRGRPLKTLTFGHMCLLERMLSYPPLSVEDICHTIMICEREYKQAEEYVYMWKWRDTGTQEELLEDIFRSPDGYLKSLIEYFESNLVCMPMLQESGGGDNNGEVAKKKKKLGSPMLAVLRVRLLRLGYKPDEIDVQPFSRCLLDAQVDMEMTGQAQVVSQEMSRAIAHLDKIVHRKEASK